MLLQINRVLSDTTLKQVADHLTSSAVWRDGKKSASGSAKEAKNNLQLSAEEISSRTIIKEIASAVTSNRVVATAARTESLARLIISRYDAGMRYDNHVDAAFMDNVRCDVSFTLFLSDPSEYEGGDLIIDEGGRTNRVKLAAGNMVLYPSTAVHRVSEVTSGVRYAAVGWIKSRIRSAEQRFILFELDKCLTELEGDENRLETRVRLANARNNLLRSWSD